LTLHRIMVGYCYHYNAPDNGRIPWRKVERQVKVLIKNLAILLLFPSKEFLPI
jgi:hypothetical protein